MKHKLLSALGLIVLAMVAFGTSPAEAQTIANGPYYATPSWDQKLRVTPRRAQVHRVIKLEQRRSLGPGDRACLGEVAGKGTR